MPRDPQGAETRREMGRCECGHLDGTHWLSEHDVSGRRGCFMCDCSDYRRKTIPPHAGEETKG